MLIDKVSVLPLYPALLRTFLGVGVCLPNLRLVMVSGEVITKSDVKIFEAMTSTESILLNCYASQEAIWVTSYRHRNGEQMQAQSLPIGKPVNGVEVQILSRDGSFLPTSKIGKITIKSHLLPSGYLGDYFNGLGQFYKDQSGIQIYASEDLGYLDPSGNLHYVGRQDAQLKIRGHLVDVRQVEKIVSEVLAFEEVIVSIHSAPNDRNKLVCYYKSKQALERSSIIQMLQTELPNYMIPSFFCHLEKLPKTPSGKISQQQLENSLMPFKYSIDANAESKSEKVIAELMAEVLGHSNFSKYDDFYDIGGDSLDGLNLSLKIEEKFGIWAASELYLPSASVVDIASNIKQKENNPKPVSAIPLNYSKSDAVFFALPVLHNHLYNYFALGDALTPTASLLGLRFNEFFHPDLVRSDQLKKSAKAFAILILEHLDGRAINLIGHSAAGIFAFETAKQLNALGHDINRLVLVDTQLAYKKLRLSFLPNFIGWPLRQVYSWLRYKSRLSFLDGQKWKMWQLLGGWSPMVIRAKKIIFFKPENSLVDDTQIKQWHRSSNNKLSVIPIRGGHNSLTAPDVALHIARALSDKLEYIETRS